MRYIKTVPFGKQGGPNGRMAYAEDCKSFYVGSIPASASNHKGEIRFFRRSSVVEQSAVNRSVVGSSPTAGAI